MAKTNSLGIKIKELKEVSYSTQITSEITDNFNEENVDMRLAFMIHSFPKDEMLEIRMMLEYRYRIPMGKPKTFFSLECSNVFLFDKLNENEDIIRLGNEETEIADPLMVRLLNICLGNTRGFAASKFAVLPINLIMPLVNPLDMIANSRKNTIDKQNNTQLKSSKKLSQKKK